MDFERAVLVWQPLSQQPQAHSLTLWATGKARL